MIAGSTGSRLATDRNLRLGIIALTAVLTCSLPASGAEEKKPSPCTEDAMIVFDASGSMSGNQTLGIPNSRARIDEVRSALAQVLPTATKNSAGRSHHLRPGPVQSVQRQARPQADARRRPAMIMNAVNALVPAGKTPLTSAVEQAAEVLNYRAKPGVIVVVTDGEETCGRSPCDAGQAAASARQPAHRPCHRFPLRGLLLDRRQQRDGPDVPRR